MTLEELRLRVARDVADRGLIGPEDRVVAAVSGGADSVFLLHALRSVPMAALHVAHLDHGLRGEIALEDAAFVEALARDLGLEVTIGHASVLERRALEGGSIEDAARRARYAFLIGVAARTGATRVAVGHTANDQAETVLFRSLRGTGVRGLRGMPVSRLIEPGSSVRVVRPLLSISRPSIEEALREAGIAWREDETNSDRRFARNTIRLDVLPALARHAIDPVSALVRLSHEAARVQGAIEARAKRLAGLVRPDAGPGLPIPIALLETATEPVREAVLRRLLGRLAGRPFPLRRAAVHRFEGLLGSAARTGARAPLGEGAEAVREPAGVRLLSAGGGRGVRPALEEIRVALPGVTVTSSGVLAARFETVLAAPRLESPLEAALDADLLPPLLTSGPMRRGDRLHPLGAPGSKELRRLLIDWKVPAALRARVPVLRSADGEVAWVVGHRIAQRLRVTARTTKLVRLRFTLSRA